MKFMARRAFALTFIILLPFVGVVNNSRVGEIIENNSLDSTSAKISAPEVHKLNTDSIVALIYQMQKRSDVKQDTSLKIMAQYAKSQNLIAMKFVEMDHTITQLNTQLKTKQVIPNQIVKDAEKGNAQKEVFKYLLMFLIMGFFVISLLVVIFIQVYKIRLRKPTSNIQ
jgi:hypothetical protein